MHFRLLTALPFLLLSATAAHAQVDEQWCRNGLFPSEPPFALGRIGGTGKAFFNNDMDGCPWQGTTCKARSYVVPGDVVIINRTLNGYACAFYPSKGGGTAGWIESKRIELMPNDTNPPMASWLGNWSSADNPTVTITSEVGILNVSGEAYWPGREPSPDYPSVHVGEIAGAITPSGNRARYSDGEGCTVDFTLLGEFLIAGDNLGCGGMNVSFSAVYRREP